jgi:hypothetical protein
MGEIRIGPSLTYPYGTIVFGNPNATCTMKGTTTFVNNVIFQNSGTTQFDGYTTFTNSLKTTNITAITETSNGVHNIYTTLTSSGTINMGATTAGTITNLRGGEINIGNNATNLTINSPTQFDKSLKIRSNKLVDELQTLTGTTETLVFPLQQTTIFTNTGNITANLPLINNDTQIGLRFTFINLGSISTMTTFTAAGTNKIIPSGQLAQFTSSTTVINNTKNSSSLVIVKLSGVYCWVEYRV